MVLAFSIKTLQQLGRFVQSRCLAFVICCGLLGPMAVFAQPLLIKPIANAKPERILFVGNSYFYYNNSLHNHVSALVKADDAALGARLQFKSSTIGGAALNHHNLSHLLTPGRIGVAQPFQWVVMQGGSGEPLSAQRRATFRKTAADHTALVRAAGGQVALYMTHAYVKPHPRVSPNNAVLTQAMYVDVGNDLQALVIPVGLAFEMAYQRHPNLKLHHPDGTHPGLLGTYLAACTTYASLYGRSPVGNAYRADGAIEADVALQLQQLADDVVSQFFQHKL
jgi:hypothetical protein